MDGAPILGHPPAFPWNQFSAILAKKLQADGLSIAISDPQWRDAGSLTADIGSPVVPLHLSVASIEGGLCWLMSQDDISLLMSLVLTKNASSRIPFDAEFQQGFYNFIVLEALDAINKIDFDKTLSPHIHHQAKLPQTPAVCLDVTITLLEHSIIGRLVVPTPFRDAWKEHYANRQMDAPLTSPLMEQVQLTVHLEAGKTSLKLSEWSAVKPGDFLILDSCTLRPGEDKGRVMLTIEGIPFFRGKIKEGNLKILEYPLYHEVETTMSTKTPGKDFEHDDEEIMDDEFEEESLGGEFAEEEIETGDLEEETEMESSESTAAPQPPSPAKIKQPAVEGISSPKDIPFSVIVEVGRLQMTIKQLMDLQPGAMLDLNIHPENGVDLIVGGKRIAKGELLLIGESLGVRILDIG